MLDGYRRTSRKMLFHRHSQPTLGVTSILAHQRDPFLATRFAAVEQELHPEGLQGSRGLTPHQWSVLTRDSYIVLSLYLCIPGLILHNSYGKLST